MSIDIVQGDITDCSVDAIVNAANEGLRGGGGVDGAIHRTAGPSVMQECRRIGRCPTGKAVITDAGLLKAKKIIHTVGPVWHGGNRNEAALLKSCYDESLKLALEKGMKSIAFPAISTGVYGYPVEKAACIAIKTGIEHETLFDRIVYVCFSKRHSDVYKAVYESLQ